MASTSSSCFPSSAGARTCLRTGSVLSGALRPGRTTQLNKSRRRIAVRCSLDDNVSDMRSNAPKGLFPPEPEHYRGPKLKVAIIGAGLAGMSTAVELLDQGHEVDIYESRSFIGGKVGSFVDRRGNHIEMGLHVFFGCYNNLFRLLKKVGGDKNLLVKDHTHTFVNEGGEIGELDFRFPIGAPIHGIRAFLATNQLKGKFPLVYFNLVILSPLTNSNLLSDFQNSQKAGLSITILQKTISNNEPSLPSSIMRLAPPTNLCGSLTATKNMEP